MKIIYIVGTGRNGSTIFDIILGNASNIQSCGEVYNAFYAWKKNKKCACSKPVTDCEFWQKVFLQYFNNNSEITIDEIIKLQKRFERKLYSPLLFFLHKRLKTKSYHTYLTSLKIFYEQITKVSQKELLVDSSKNPFRGAALLETFKEKVFFIHLVRDGRGQLMSWFRSGTIPPLNITIKNTKHEKIHWWAPVLYSFSWIFYNLLSGWIIRTSLNGYFRIQYQDFVTSPDKYLVQIADFIDEKLENLTLTSDGQSLLEIGHLVAGNRVRFQNNLKLKSPDERWRTQLKNSHQKVFWVFAGWLAKKYGYKF